MNEKLEKLNRQKTAAEKKLIAAQHREKQLEHDTERENPPALHSCRDAGEVSA